MRHVFGHRRLVLPLKEEYRIIIKMWNGVYTIMLYIYIYILYVLRVFTYTIARKSIFMTHAIVIHIETQ